MSSVSNWLHTIKKTSLILGDIVGTFRLVAAEELL